MIFGTRKQLAKMEYNGISVADDIIQTKACVQNLGVYMVNEMEMDRHFNMSSVFSIENYAKSHPFENIYHKMSQKSWSYEASLVTRSIPNPV